MNYLKFCTTVIRIIFVSPGYTFFDLNWCHHHFNQTISCWIRSFLIVLIAFFDKTMFKKNENKILVYKFYSAKSLYFCKYFYSSASISIIKLFTKSNVFIHRERSIARKHCAVTLFAEDIQCSFLWKNIPKKNLFIYLKLLSDNFIAKSSDKTEKIESR